MLRGTRASRSASSAAAAADAVEATLLHCSMCRARFNINDDAAMPPLPAGHAEASWTCTGCADAQAISRSGDISLANGYAEIDAKLEAAAPPSMTLEERELRRAILGSLRIRDTACVLWTSP